MKYYIINSTIKPLLVILLFFCTTLPSFAQKEKNEQRKKFYTALNYMYDEKYDKALSLLLQLDTMKLESFLKEKDVKLKTDTISLEKIYVKYMIGACYLQMKYEMENTIPYVEYVINSGYSETPEIVYKDLGAIYHKDYQFNKAIYYFNKYLKKTKPEDEFYDYTKRMIEICQNAIEITKDTLHQDIFHLGHNINSEDSESVPLVSAANDVMVFKFQQYIEDPRINKGTPIIIQQTKLSQKELGVWKKAKTIIFDTPDNFEGQLSVVGLSYGGAQLFVKLRRPKKFEYYSTLINRYRCQDYEKLNFINGKFDISHINMSPDGNLVFFSGRPTDNDEVTNDDIYMVIQNQNGKWMSPVKLGPEVNTKYNEINPVMAHRGDVLYFSSEGHNTMGGFDIFKVKKLPDGRWSQPINLGFPINTTEDNDDFYVSNRGFTGYFSATQFDKYNNRDIYSVNIRENIPVTLINGRLLAGDSLQPVNAKIHILEDGENSQYLINSNPKKEDGSYYVFCPPDNDYEMLIEAEGYVPQVVSIHVPKQSYFYTLFQEIQLKPIKAVDATLGEEIIVKNAFYDVQREHVEVVDITTDNQKYEELIKLIDEVKEKDKADSINVDIEEKDYEELFNFVETAIEEEDSFSLGLLREHVASQDLYSQSYFFTEDSTNSHTNQVKVGDRTVFSAPPVDARGKKKKAKPTLELKELIHANRIVSILPDSISAKLNKKEIDTSPPTNDTTTTSEVKATRSIFTYQVLFESNSAKCDSTYYSKIDDLIDLLTNNDKLKIEVAGYSNSIGAPDPNLKLSRERAMNVVKYIKSKGIDKDRIIVKYFGETYSLDEKSTNDRIRNRRVELKIVEIQHND